MHRDARRAAEWARRALADPNTRILDTETTGLGPYDEVIELALINVAGELLYNARFNPLSGIEISLGAQAVHGISKPDLINCPSFAAEWETIRGLLHTRTVVTYNMAFDHQLIHQTLHHYRSELGLMGVTWHCAMLEFAAFYGACDPYHGDYRWQPLHVAARVAGRLEDRTHSALGDALTTLAVLRYMAGSLEETPPQTPPQTYLDAQPRAVLDGEAPPVYYPDNSEYAAGWEDADEEAPYVPPAALTDAQLDAIERRFQRLGEKEKEA